MNFFGFGTFKKRITIAVAAAAMLASAARPAGAFTSADADTAVEAYLRSYLIPVRGGSFLKGNEYGGDPGFWQEVEEIEGIEDANERTGGRFDIEVSTLLYGFVATHGRLWTDNIYNDDIAWGVIALMRAYKQTGDANFRTLAKENFDMMWARAWNPEKGTLWWTTDNTSFNSCIECPAGIAAYLLSEGLEDKSYLEKAKTLYAWNKANLFDAKTGAVWDSVNLKGEIGKWASTYNQGTFLGLANYLGDFKTARRAADYMKEKMTHTDLRVNGFLILPGYDTHGRNNAGLTSIGLRWVSKFMKDCKLEKRYLRWLQTNANVAWSVRRADNLSWCLWDKPTPSYNLPSWDAINTVVALQVVPPDEKVKSPKVPYISELSRTKR